MAKLSLAMGRERGFVQQVLTQNKRRRFSVDDLRQAAPMLGVSLATLIEKAYGIDVEELATDSIALSNARSSELRLEELTDDQYRELLRYAEFLRQRDEGTPRL